MTLVICAVCHYCIVSFQKKTSFSHPYGAGHYLDIDMLSQSDSSNNKAVSKSKEYVLRLDAIEDERKMVAPICKVHFAKQPMKLRKARKQYLFDDSGNKPLFTVTV